MYNQLFTHDERLNGFAHGFYEMSRNGQWIIGHGGDTLLFHSLLALLPDQNVGLFVSYNSEGAQMMAAQALLAAFIDRYYPVEPETVQLPTGFAERAGRFTGGYRMNRSSYTTLEKVMGLFVTISVRAADDDTLVLSSPFGKQRFAEVEPLVFREVDEGDLLLFREDDQGNIAYAFLDILPILALEKLAWYEAPTFHYVLLIICLVLFLSAIIAAPISFFINRSRDGGEPPPRLARLARWLLGGVAVLSILFAIGFAVAMSDVAALMMGDASLLNILMVIPIVVTLLTIGAVILTVLAWKDSYWGLSGRIHYTLVTLAAVACVWFFNYWNMLGWRF